MTSTPSDWEARMSAKAAARRPPNPPAPEDAPEDTLLLPDRSTWPVPDKIKSYSARDVFLWYVCRGWEQILGGDVQTLFDHDFGYHVLSNGTWQLTFVNLSEFPDQKFGTQPPEQETLDA